MYCKNTNLTLHNSFVIASQISPRGVVLPRTQQGKQLQGELIYVCYFFTMLICMLNKLKPGCIGKKNLLYSAPVAALANLPPSIIENFFCSASAFLKGFSRQTVCILQNMAFSKCVPIVEWIESVCLKSSHIGLSFVYFAKRHWLYKVNHFHFYILPKQLIVEWK